jgi:hypothetical protein
MDMIRNPARFQFSVRGLLWATLIAAIMSAIAAPVVRNMSAEHWRISAVALAPLAIGFFLTLLWMLWSVHLVERNAGRLLYETPQLRSKVLHSTTVLLIFIAMLMSSVMMASATFAMWPWMAFGIFLSMQAAQSVAMIWLPARFGALYRMHEKGVIRTGFRFVPWDNVRIMRWRTDTGWLAWSLDGHYCSFDVPAHDRAQVDGILKKYYSKA